MVVIGTGYSYLRQFMPQVAAGALKAGWARMVGAGRLGLAYPDYPRDVLRSGRPRPEEGLHSLQPLHPAHARRHAQRLRRAGQGGLRPALPRGKGKTRMKAF